MFREFLRSKIHRATVTKVNLHYNGSLSIDEEILEASGILVNERIYIYNIHTGQRFETYAIKAPRGSKEFGLNGAAARMGSVGDLIIVVAYCYLNETEIASHKARIVILGEGNQIQEILDTQ
jgi:aspartate 1-decarboxylase